MAAQPQQSNVLSFEEARKIVEDHAAGLRPSGRELVNLMDAGGRVLAESIHADRDFPPFPRAARDGYAIRAGDLENQSAGLDVVGEAKAGAAEIPPVTTGKAVAIMTGAAVPAGADTVVMVERTWLTAGRVRVNGSVSAGENIVHAGSEARRGEEMLACDTRLGYAQIGVAASVGRPRLVVHARPKVAVLSTGDEVVDVDVPPGVNQIRNSNSYSLAIQIQGAGGEPVLLPIAPDEPQRLRELLIEGMEADLLLIAGGVSMGKYDLVEQVLSEMKAEFFFTGAQIQPGRPIVFGRVPWGAGAPARESVTTTDRHTYFFGLPGNPISTMVTFELFARPLLEALAGMIPGKLVFVHAKLSKEIRTKTGLKRFLPALLSGEYENARVELVRWQGSGDIAAAARANCYVVVPPDRERIDAGEWVAVLLR